MVSSSSSSRGVAASSGQQHPFDNFGGGLRELRGKCSQGYVNCVGGYLADSDRSITCVDACMDAGGTNPLCCDGDTAPCDGTTGKICKDGSCNGNFACNYAVFEAVVNGCKGESACDNMGYYAAHGAGEIINSCDGYKSCYKAGYGDGGGMRGLENSCNANQACQQLGDVAYGPVTTDLKDCCNISQGCYQYNDASIPTECKVAVSVLPNFLAHFIISLSRVLFLTPPHVPPTRHASSRRGIHSFLPTLEKLTQPPTHSPTTTTQSKAGKNKKQAKTSKPTQAPTISAAPVKAKAAKKNAREQMNADLFD